MDRIRTIGPNETLSKRESREMTLSLAVEALEELDCPRALSVRILMRYGEWDQIAQGLPIDFEHWYDDPYKLYRDYQATALLKKADFLQTTFDRREVALKRFMSAEEQCRETNRRWRRIYDDGRGIPPLGIDGILSDARFLIHRILGRFPAERLLDNCRWGPGSTTSIRNPRTSVYDKYLEPVTGSGLCLSFFASLIKEATLWSEFQGARPFCVNDGNKVLFVYKDATTDRSIAAEPSFDSWVQLGIGALMRERFLLFGVNLNSQQLNRDLAYYGSVTGKVATVDMTMASDTEARKPVEYLFPKDWVLAMKCSRSAHWRMRSTSGVYHKFSSMGNGYTFETESILFFALARACADRMGLPWWEVTAFGDDVTIPSEALPLFRDVLAFCGFTVNERKSFGTGPFRESCGEDYFLGTNVRPYFVRTLLRDQRDLMKFHNGLQKGLIPLKRTASRAAQFIEPSERLWGPRSLGDTVLWSPCPKGRYRLASKKWPMYEGFIIDHWVFKPKKTRVRFYEPAILASLNSNREAPTLGFATQRKRGTWKTTTVVVPAWDD